MVFRVTASQPVAISHRPTYSSSPAAERDVVGSDLTNTITWLMEIKTQTNKFRSFYSCFQLNKRKIKCFMIISRKKMRQTNWSI